ncbi:FlgO family outer membrane protein [Arsukibacterium sp. MJ3]|uniref:FlgO family outer membrane protein n=1 Tax=Arsukibacterium sp. MJ3 TaxID=1632859 RepID=UPI000699F881|nr:FlgO family outer membrane protein [Arsukibacterium sp. MJ3]
MIKNILLLATGTIVLLLTSCSSLLPGKQTHAQPAPAITPYILTHSNDNRAHPVAVEQVLMTYPVTNRLYASQKSLDDYVAQLAMQLYHNSTEPFANHIVAVAGFTSLTPARDALHPLGNALAERFLQQMPRYGLIMVDHKLTGGIMLTNAGDQVFSNRAGQVAANQQIDYVLSGTVQQSQRGAQVNVRIMHLKNKSILASASQLIPQFVLDTEPFVL